MKRIEQTNSGEDTLYISYNRGNRGSKGNKAIAIVLIVATILILGVAGILYGYMVSDSYQATSATVGDLSDVMDADGNIVLAVAGGTSYQSFAEISVAVEPFLIGYDLEVADTSIAKVENSTLYAVKTGTTELRIYTKDESIEYTYKIIVYDASGNFGYTVNYLNENTNTILKSYVVTSGRSMAEMGYEAPDMPSMSGYTASSWVLSGTSDTFFSDTIVTQDCTIVVEYEPQQVVLYGGELSTGTIAYKSEMEEFSIASRAASGSGSGYKFSSENMPAGLVLQEDGVIYGTPFVSGEVSFIVEVEDPNGTTASAEFYLTIDKKTLDVYMSNATVVYDGTAKSITVTLVGIAENDEVYAEVIYSTTPIEVGSYLAVFGGLSGADSDNYTYNTYISKQAILTITAQ